ncbi:hemerythrin domain-containing protein [Aquabacterium sp.]|uniref:hemerythrin domain-containing protein n=1 Tax=Aquabacterium sp. TaxID=1872578 RepID=UPI0035B01D08
MSSFTWSEEMALDLPAIDHLHTECTDLINAVIAASDADLLSAWDKLIAHTAEHFAQEDRWMQDTGFAPNNCHSSQHAIVLKIMREGAEKGANGDLGIVRQMAQELTLWLPHHIDAMDAGLVMHLRNVGYNTETGEITAPEALPETTLTSCSVEPCDDHA